MLVPGSRDAAVRVASWCLLVGLATSPTVCPPQCACRDVSVDCRRGAVSTLADVAHLLPPEAEELDLGQNDAISAVNRTDFPLLTRLRR